MHHASDHVVLISSFTRFSLLPSVSSHPGDPSALQTQSRPQRRFHGEETTSFFLPLVPSDNNPFVTMRGLLFARWRRCKATSGWVFAYETHLCYKADGLAALVPTLPRLGPHTVKGLDDQRNVHGAIFLLVVFPSKVLLSIICFPFSRWDQSLVSFICSP
jgi:hypothetical protein